MTSDELPMTTVVAARSAIVPDRRRVAVQRFAGRSRRLTFSLAAALLALVVSACNSEQTSEPSVPSTAPYMAGRVTSVLQTGTSTISVRIEANPLSPTQGLKAVAAVDGVTLVLLPDRKPGDQRSLALGQWVRLWFDGPIAESYPVQGTASTIVIDSIAITPNGG